MALSQAQLQEIQNTINRISAQIPSIQSQVQQLTQPKPVSLPTANVPSPSQPTQNYQPNYTPSGGSPLDVRYPSNVDSYGNPVMSNPNYNPATGQVSQPTGATGGISRDELQQILNQNKIYDPPSTLAARAGTDINSSDAPQKILNYLSGQGLVSQSTKVGNMNLQQLMQMMNPQQDQSYLTAQQNLLTKIADLQNQMATSKSDSPELASLRQMILQQQKALQDLTPNKYLQSQPGLQNIGISQSFLERRVAQEREPMANTLANLLMSQSILGEDEERKRKALEAQIQVAQTNFGLTKELQALKPQPFKLPETVQSEILKNFLGLNKSSLPTSVQEFQYAQQSPKYAEFLQTGKKDETQQQFLNEIKTQQLQIQLQNSQNSAERNAILNELRLLNLQQQTATSPGQIVNAKTNLPVKLTDNQSQFFSMGIRLNENVQNIKTTIDQIGTNALKGWVTEKGYLVPVVQNKLDPKQQNLMQKMFELNNMFVYFSTGKQINETEFERLSKQTPQFRATKEYNASAINNFSSMIQDRMNNYLKVNGWKIYGNELPDNTNDPMGIR